MPQSTPKKRVLFVHRFMPGLLLLLGVFSLGLLNLRSMPVVQAATSNTVNFQARLENASGSIAPDGNYNVEFKLYGGGSCTPTTGAGCTALWTEDYLYNGGSPDQRLRVANGYLSSSLGSVTAFPTTINWDQPLYVSTNIGGSGTVASWDGAMLPYLKLTAVPYAFRAGSLATTNAAGTFTSTLSIQAPTGGSQTFQIQDQGAAGTYNLLTTNQANSSYVQFAPSSAQGDTSVNPSIYLNDTGGGNLIQLQEGGATQFVVSTTGVVTTNTIQIATSGSLDTSSAGTLNIGLSSGGNATSISINQSATLAASKSITITGSASRPGSPTKGMLYFDTTTNQLIQYNGSKWMSAPKSATVIIAASNSSQAEKDAADYVAGSTGAQTTINSAFTSTACTNNSGCLVYLMEGTYNLSAAISIPNNSTLAGAGAATIITIPSAQNGSYNMIANSDTSTGTQITVRDLLIDGNRTAQTSGTMDGIHLTNMGGGSGTTARTGAKITNVIIKNLFGSGSNGIALVTSNNNTLTGNTVLNNANTGIWVSQSSYNTLTGNTAQGNGSSGISVSGTSAEYNTLTGNTVQGNQGSGIWLPNSSYTTLSGNSTQGNTVYGIGLLNSNYNTITAGNVAQGNTTYGIFLDGSSYNTVSGNTAQGNGSYAIILTNVTGSGASNNNNITGNKIADSGGSTGNDGIYLGGTVGKYASNNSITNNDITDTSCTTTCYAINISNAGNSKNYLSNNRFAGDGTNVASVNDLGSGTVYADQARGENGGQLTVRTANDAAAFQVQNAAGVNVLGADTSAGQAVLGAASTLTGAIKFYSLAGTGSVTLTLNNPGSNNFTLSIPTLTGNDTICTVGAGNCGGSGGGSITLGTYSTTNTDAHGATLSAGVLTFQNASATAPGMVGTGAQTFAGNKQFNGNLSVATSAAPNAALEVGGNGLLLSGSTYQTFLTPQGLSVNTKINIPLANPGNFGQLLALGLPSGASSSSRAISIFDNRAAGNNQPVLSIFSPDENNMAGINWNGSSTTAHFESYAANAASNTPAAEFQSGDTSGVGTSTGNVILQSGNGNGTNNNSTGNVTVDAGTATGSGTAGTVNIGTTNARSVAIGRSSTTTTVGGTLQASNGSLLLGTASTSTGTIKFYSSTGSGSVTLNLANGTSTGNYTLTIPSISANDTICLQTAANCGGGGGGGSISLGTYSTTNTDAHGATLSAGVLTFQNASATAPGMVGTGNQTFAGAKTFSSTLTASATGGNALAITGAPAANSGSSLIQIGNPIQGGNSSANGGTYIGINLPSTGAGSLADYLNFESAGVSVFKVNDGGTLTMQGDISALNGEIDGQGVVGVGYLYAGSSNQFQVDGSGNISTTGTELIKTDATYAFRIQNSTGNDLLWADTSANELDVYGLTHAYGGVTSDDEIYAAGDLSSNYLYIGSSAQLQVDGSGNLTTTGTGLVKTTSASALLVQNAGGNTVLGVDTSASQVLFGKASTVNGSLLLYNSSNANTVTMQSGATSASYNILLPTGVGLAGQCLAVSSIPTTGTEQLGYATCGGGGGGGGTQTVTLVPEFAGVTFHADGTNNTGYMSSDHVSGLTSGQGYKHNFYEWSTDQATAQDYDIISEYQLPTSFSNFTGSTWKMWVYGDNAGDVVSYTIKDAGDHSCATGSYTTATTGQWTQVTLTTTNLTTAPCSYAANDVITIDFNLSSASSTSTDYVKLGEVSFTYN